MSASFVLDGWYRKVSVTSNPGGGEFSSLFFSFIGTSTHPFSIIDFILTVPAPRILFNGPISREYAMGVSPKISIAHRRKV